MPRLRRPRSPTRLLRQVAAAALACLALVLALRPPQTVAGSPPGQVLTPVVVAAADLAAGVVLTRADLRTVEFPAGATPAGTTADPEELAGRILAGPVRSGEPVSDVRVIGPGLWSSVPDGQVAAPVRLADLAVATLLRAGDRVDVLAATGDGPGPGPGSGSGPGPTVEVVAADALVLTAPAAPEDPDQLATEGSGLLVLAVAPETAQRLAAAGAGAGLTVTLGAP